MRRLLWGSFFGTALVIAAACGSDPEESTPKPEEAGIGLPDGNTAADTGGGTDANRSSDAGADADANQDADASDASLDAGDAADAGPNAIVSLSGGAEMMCVLRADGKVKCWGTANFLGLEIAYPNNKGDDAGEMGANLPFVDLGNGVTASALFGGSYTYTQCILTKTTGDLRCWGANHVGQLGGDLADAAQPYRGDAPGEMGAAMHTIDLGAGRKAIQVSTTNAHACAILDNAKVKCWGNNGDGQLGILMSGQRGDDPNEMGDNLPYVDLGVGRTAKAIHVANARSCVITDEDKVKCWGSGTSGQTGRGSTAAVGGQGTTLGDTLLNIDLGAGRTAKQITGGLTHACALLDDASVKCWGYNQFGQLGIGTTDNRGDGAGEMGNALPAVNLGVGRTAKAISSGAEHTCAILDNDQLKCWGKNNQGQLGYGDNTDRGTTAASMTNLDYVDLGNGRTARAVQAMASSTCALLDDGSLKCWGYNAYGQLGLGHALTRGNAPNQMGDAALPVDLGP